MAWRPRIEPLEGRELLSYLVVAHRNKVIPIHVGDARVDEPLFSNGLAVKKGPHFYPLYTGPRRAELNGVQAVGFVSGENVVLSGTVAGAIVQNPSSSADASQYTFLIDRGGSSRQGPFPGRPHIRFDTIIAINIAPKAVTAYFQITDSLTHLFQGTKTPVPASDVSIHGSVVTVTIPLKMLPSSGHAYDQWNANFMTSNPAQRQTFHSIASFTPEFTEFQIHAKPLPGQ